ncbi:aminopeptidase, partial [Klebsiella pneumoniae]|nr:aminopeptidase [Klebsiella pneumoniae]
MSGILYAPNIPTEEVFTLPDRARVDGYVTSTRPFSVNGELVQEFTLTFEQGRVTGVKASQAQD